jgi:hypothetical protein
VTQYTVARLITLLSARRLGASAVLGDVGEAEATALAAKQPISLVLAPVRIHDHERCELASAAYRTFEIIDRQIVEGAHFGIHGQTAAIIAPRMTRIYDIQVIIRRFWGSFCTTNRVREADVVRWRQSAHFAGRALIPEWRAASRALSMSGTRSALDDTL